MRATRVTSAQLVTCAMQSARQSRPSCAARTQASANFGACLHLSDASRASACTHWASRSSGTSPRVWSSSSEGPHATSSARSSALTGRPEGAAGLATRRSQGTRRGSRGRRVGLSRRHLPFRLGVRRNRRPVLHDESSTAPSHERAVHECQRHPRSPACAPRASLRVSYESFNSASERHQHPSTT